MSTTLLVDGHVHYHSCFGVAPFLEAAQSNFKAARQELGRPNARGCLMFTESSWSHYFGAFADGLVERATEGWWTKPTGENCSLVAGRKGEPELLLVAGRQIVTSDRLEVLALATSHEFPDGLPIAQAIGLVRSSDAVAVLPWGFGKWTGRRGRVIRDILTSSVAEEVCLGDNGGRAAVGPRPALFDLAESGGVPILLGSDPLPLPAEVGKPGRCGFVLEGPVDAETPAAAIRTMLSKRPQPRPYGRLERLGTFVRRQAALRLRRGEARRVPGAPSAERPET